MAFKRFISCLLITVLFPYGIVKIIPENIRVARQIEKAPHQPVTVAEKWTKPINSKMDGYWIRFREPVANPRQVQITSDEWNSLSPGGHITIAVLPDGRPHTLRSGENAAFEQTMFVLAIVIWAAATAYVIAAARRWASRRHREYPAIG